ELGGRARCAPGRHPGPARAPHRGTARRRNGGGAMTTTPSPPAAVAGGRPRPPPAGAGRRPVDVRVNALRRFAAPITIFPLPGPTVLGFEQARITPIACVLVSYLAALVFETLDAWALGRRPEYAGGWRPLTDFLLPAHIVGLASAVILYGNSSAWPY